MPHRLVLLLCAWFGLVAQTAAAPGLLELFELAEQHDPELAAADALRRAKEEAIPQARSALLPQLGAKAAINRTHRELEKSPISLTQNYNSELWALSLSQVIYDRQAFLALDQADAQVEVARLNFARAQQDVILRVSQAYFDLLFAEDSLRLAEAKKQATLEQLQQAENMLQGGMGTVTDVQEAKARLDLAASEVMEAQTILQIRRQALFRLTGRWLDAVAPLVDMPPLPPPEPNDLEAWLDEARRSALEVRAAEKALEAARLNVARARSGRLPVLKLVGSTQRQSNTDLGYDSDHISSIGLQLSLPILEGGKVNSQTREALAAQDQAAEQLRLAQSESALQAAEAFHGVNNGIMRVQALTQAVHSSEVALDAARIGHSIGYRTLVDVLNAQQQVFAARRDLLEQRYNVIFQWLRLKAAVGALTREDVQAVDSWLDK